LSASVALAAFALATAPSRADDALDPAAFDPTVAPNVDFYRFATGGWLASHPIPADRDSWGSFDEARERSEQRLRELLEAPAQSDAPVGSERRKLGDFYAACTDLEDLEARGVDALAPSFAAIAAVTSAPRLGPLFARLAAESPDAAPGFNFGSEQDPAAATRVIAALGQGGLVLPGRDYYLSSDPRTKAIRAAYVRFVERSFILLGDGVPAAARETFGVLDLETALARVSRAPAGLRDPFENYHPMPLSALEARAPGFPWRAYLARAGVPAASLTRIDVAQPEFIAGFAALARLAPLGEWKSYLRWHELFGLEVALPHAFRDEGSAFRRAVFGPGSDPPRRRECVAATDAALGFALGKVYVAAYFPPAARERARREVAALRAALGSDLARLAWMGPATRAAALRKLSKLGTSKVGYPDRSRNYSALAVAGGRFLEDLLAANRFAFAHDAAKIGKPFDRSEWALTPQTVNAYYDASANEIVVPAGILQPPFFDPNADDAVNFGALGAIVGHELTHGYDAAGGKFDGDGNLNPILSPADAARFRRRVACVVAQAGAYKTAVGLHLRGALVADEATADLGGLTLAYRAMEASFAASGRPADVDGFTAEERFYLAWAQVWRENMRPERERELVLTDPHPVPAYRVNVTVSDQPGFLRAFAVTRGSPMYRAAARRCAVW
jgi:predicted metalloendopeptidase